MKPIENMVARGHERVCIHNDRESGLRAIIAVHSTVLGNALGGTRRWHYTHEEDALEDVLRLSQGMTYKAACAGLAMGGAKSVILLPEPCWEATRPEALAMGRFVDSLNGTYIAAEDVGVNPQFIDWMNEETAHAKGGTADGQGGDPSPYTALGVFRGMQSSLQRMGIDQFAGLTVAIQGVGSVGAHLATLLHEHGAELVVSDINADAVAGVVEACNAREIGVDEILTTECDILAPCALGAVIGKHNIDSLQARVICGASNNQLVEQEEDAIRLRDRGILYAPDFIVNAGGLIHLAGLYLGMTETELDQKVDEIEGTTSCIFEAASDHPSTAHAAIALAKHRIDCGSPQEQFHAG